MSFFSRLDSQIGNLIRKRKHREFIQTLEAAAKEARETDNIESQIVLRALLGAILSGHSGELAHTCAEWCRSIYPVVYAELIIQNEALSKDNNKQ